MNQRFPAKKTIIEILLVLLKQPVPIPWGKSSGNQSVLRNRFQGQESGDNQEAVQSKPADGNKSQDGGRNFSMVAKQITQPTGAEKKGQQEKDGGQEYFPRPGQDTPDRYQVLHQKKQ
jgi:hypothetical protein